MKFLSILFYIISSFIPDTQFPVVPVQDVDSVVVKSPQLQCGAGCHLVPDDIEEVACSKLVGDYDGDDGRVVAIADQKYKCAPDVDIPDHVKFSISKFECQFSDEESKMLIDSSCSATITLMEKKSRNSSSYYDFLVRYVLAFILTALVLMAIGDYIKKNNRNNVVKWKPPCVTEAVSDSKESFQAQDIDREEKYESYRAEQMFQQGHSLIKERQKRGRSRSRRR